MPPFSASSQWTTLTLYDVLPAPCRAVDDASFALKDYGDAAGDAYFAIRSLLPPLLCDTCASEDPYEETALCVRYNGISVGTCYSEAAYEGVSVARKIAVEVPVGTSFGGYGACNPMVDMENNAATDEELCSSYECTPSDAGVEVADGIGVERLTTARVCNDAIGFNLTAEAATPEHADALRALHYDYHLCRELDGAWYSVGNASFADTHWRRPRLVKAIDAQCQERVLHEAVRAARGTACFDACPERAGLVSEDGAIANRSLAVPYDTSSLCYIGCFYETLLGPGADVSAYEGGGGMGVREITRAWLRAFDDCPDYEEDAAVRLATGARPVPRARRRLARLAEGAAERFENGVLLPS